MEQNTSKAYAEDDPLASAMTGAGAGSSLFIINLCASLAPVQMNGKNLPGLENYRLYQVARVEDGRTRHRLRLGFFTSESHAESVLTVVRQQYPTAFTACLRDEDMKFARGYVPESVLSATRPPMPALAPIAKTAASEDKAVVVKAPPATTAPVAKPNVAAPPANAATPAPAAQARQAAPVKPPAPAAPVPAAAPAAAKVESDIVEVTWEPETKPQPKPQPAPAAKAAPASAPAKPVPPSATSIATDDDFVWEPPALNAAKKLAGDAVDFISTTSMKAQPVIKAAKPAPAKTPSEGALDFLATTSLKAQAAKSAKPAAATPPPKAPVDAAPVAKDASASSTRIKVPELTFSDPPPAPAAPSAPANTNQPFHVGKGVQIGELPITLDADAAPKAASKAPSATPSKAPANVATPAPVAAKKPVAAPPPATTPAPQATKHPAPAPQVAKPAAPAPQVAKPAAPAPASRVPDLDTTQTIRALTSAELNDDAEKFFAIQLAASEQPVNLDTMPHLDIFEAYRLYSIATAGSGKIVHSLRLGFFKEAVSAEAVCGYLKTFFASPTVLRVSVAEHARFKDSVAPRRPASKEEAKNATVVDLSAARQAPTLTMEVAPRAEASGSHRMNDSGTFKPEATGAFRANGTGSHRTLTPSLKSAAKNAAPATKRSEPVRKTGSTGKYKAPIKKSLSEQLMDEAREVELSESAIRKLPKSGSLLSKLLGK